MNKHIYTVSIINVVDVDADIWTSAFSTEKKAKDFKEKVEKWIEDNFCYGSLKVNMDSGTLDSESYLEMLVEEYGE